jgi:hypothetical protein
MTGAARLSARRSGRLVKVVGSRGEEVAEWQGRKVLRPHGDHAGAVRRAMVRAWEAEGVASRSEVLQLQQIGSRWKPLEP